MTSAQEYIPFADSNAIWNIASTFASTDEEVLGISGDTVINLKTYKKIFGFESDTVFQPGHAKYIGGIRDDDSGKVFLVWDQQPGEEILLYDFTLGIDDTVKSESNEGYLSYDNVIVTDVDSVLIFGKYYGKITLTNTLFGTDQWIEHIGSIKGPLHPVLDYIIGTTDVSLWCYKQNDTVYYLGNPDCGRCFCNVHASVDDKSTDNNIRVYPNPAFGYVIAETKEGILRSFKLFDMNGRMIYKMENRLINKIVFETTYIQSGLYYYRIRTNDSVFAGKIVVR
jgi:hypothetical protein